MKKVVSPITKIALTINHKICDFTSQFFLRRKIIRHSNFDKYNIPSSLDDQVVHLRCGSDSRNRAAENLRRSYCRCRCTLDPHSRVLAPCHSTCIGVYLVSSDPLGSIWSIQIPGTRVPGVRSAGFFPSVISGDDDEPSSAIHHPRISRARRTFLPRNYFRMIPIVGQIKTALSALHADRSERRPPLVCELFAKIRVEV